MNSDCNRSVVRRAVGLVLHLADDVYVSMCQCRGVQRDATAYTVGAVRIVNGHFGADTEQSVYTCMGRVRAVVDEPRHGQFLRVVICDVTLYGLLLSFCHCCVFW